MIKHRKTILFILLAYALFIVGIYDVRADTGSIAFSDGTSYACYDGSGNTGGCTTMTLDYFRKNNTTWLHYNAPSNYFYAQNNYVTYFTNNNMNSINTTNYDYVLVHIITYGGIVPNSILVGDAYGYNMSTNITQNICYNTYQTGGGELCFDSVYDSIMKIDTSTNTSIGGQIKIYFSANSGGGVDYGNSRIFIAEQVYLGKTGDSMSSTIASNTTDINNKLSDSSIDTNNTSSSVGGFSSSTNGSMTNTPVSSMISLPITFLTGVNNALSNSCTNVNYIELFGYQLVLPCLNLSERLGSVWTIIDTIFSCMLIFSIGKSLVSTFARLSDMDTNIMYECYANGTKHRGESFDD